MVYPIKDLELPFEELKEIAALITALLYFNTFEK